MKKKIVAFLCVIACILSLAACGKHEYTLNEQTKISEAQSASEVLVQIAQAFGTEDQLATITDNYAKHESQSLLQYYAYQLSGRNIEADLGVFEGLLTTYVQASADMGGEITVGSHTAEIIGDDIVVTYDLTGEKANGKLTFKFENDMFLKLTSAEAVADLTFKQNMQKAGKNMGNAGLNTILGMGVVFAVLILISLIISSFSLFKKQPKPVETKSQPAATAAPETVEELTDDTELVAVIMAAISAYEGANGGSADGFVVRSIRRANRRN